MAEVVAAAAWWWRPAWQRRRQLGRSAILAVAAAHLEVRQQQHGVGGDNVVYAGNNFNGHDDNDD